MLIRSSYYCLRGAVFISLLFNSYKTINAQVERAHHNAVGLSFTGLAYQDAGQYLGLTVDYTYQPRSWIGLQAQATHFPTTQSTASSVGGGTSTEFVGSVLLGHRFKRVTPFIKVGAGDFRVNVFQNADSSGVYLGPRNSKSFQFGANVDFAMTRRVSIRFESVDLEVHSGPFTQYAFGTAYPSVAHFEDFFQFTSGIVYHFK